MFSLRFLKQIKIVVICQLPSLAEYVFRSTCTISRFVCKICSIILYYIYTHITTLYMYVFTHICTILFVWLHVPTYFIFIFQIILRKCSKKISINLKCITNEGKKESMLKPTHIYVLVHLYSRKMYLHTYIYKRFFEK